jgi:5-deoxy-glucuronate isomerase
LPGAEPRLHRPAGSLADGGDLVHVTPAVAGWAFSGLRVVRVEAGQSRVLDTGDSEVVVLPLSGSCVVRTEGQSFRLEGRRSVFERVTDFAYVPRDARLEIESDAGGEFALPMARARRRLPAAYGPAEKVPVEIRGAGDATRQVTNFCTPSSFPADRLSACELITPAGNWSSFPPHKHDEARADEAVLEEIYYFRIAGPAGFAMHRTYAADGAFDVTVTVADGDVFLVPRGYHGPSVASPGHDLYYLNVLAGPGAERTMAFCDDPRHHWIRETWSAMLPDPRVPMTSAKGRTR